ncbi:stabilizer of axonemal microtubules 3 isoform X2 [Brachyhypopomus gauderio]|uniref:stabilizer of axonemal microtubules 3 isoform X2 n=1 Tax=Brachyhypopomus gauderio TaxID=698409 RepID=UPI0040430A6B
MYRLCKEKRSLRETSTGVGHAHARALPFHTHSTKLQACESLRVVSAPISETHDCYKGQSASHEAPMGYYKTLQALYGQLNTAHSALALLPKEPLFSTTQSDYRHFCRSELSPSSALDAPPIQGTMTKSGALIRLPTRKAPPSVAAQPQLPRPSVPLPHGSKSSQYMDSFAVPNPPPIFSTPAPDWGKDAGGKSLLQHILEVPKMYVTENQNYGHRNTVLL